MHIQGGRRGATGARGDFDVPTGDQIHNIKIIINNDNDNEHDNNNDISNSNDNDDDNNNNNGRSGRPRRPRCPDWRPNE